MHIETITIEHSIYFEIIQSVTIICHDVNKENFLIFYNYNKFLQKSVW